MTAKRREGRVGGEDGLNRRRGSFLFRAVYNRGSDNCPSDSVGQRRQPSRAAKDKFRAGDDILPADEVASLFLPAPRVEEIGKHGGPRVNEGW